jgi:hypothetical protein
VLGLGGIIFIVVCYFSVSFAFDTKYVQLLPLVVGFLFGILGVFCLASLFKTYHITVSEKGLELDSILGIGTKNYRWEEIDSYTYKVIKDKKGTEESFRIYIKDKVINLSSQYFEDYEKLFHLLSKKIKINAEQQIKRNKSDKIIAGRFSMGSGLFFIFLGLHLGFSPYNNFDENDLQLVSGTLVSAEYHEGRKNNHSFIIKMEEYPDYSFVFSDFAFESVNYKGFLESSKPSDEVGVKILKISYDKKITETRKLNFWDKTINYPRIETYGLELKGKSYFSFDLFYNYNNSKLSSLIILVVLCFGVFILINGYLLTQNKGYWKLN